MRNLSLALMALMVSTVIDAGIMSVSVKANPVRDTARAVHESLLVLDTHLDTPALFDRFGWDIMDRHVFAEDASQVDYPRMVDGGLDGGFWVIYTPQGALDPQGYAQSLALAIRRAGQIHKFVADNPDDFALARRSVDIQPIVSERQRIVFISMENSYPLGLDLNNLAMFHQLGVRMAGPVHSATNQFADSTTGDVVHNGLSDLGKKWVGEMNRLGMIIDASHASDAAFDDLLAASKAPIILSHSGPKALLDHPRNLDDDRMRALAAKGGVMQVNSLFLSPDAPDPMVEAAGAALDDVASIHPDALTMRVAEYAPLRATLWRSDADFDRFMAAVFYAINVMGIDHVGIGADWDGGGGVPGMEDITKLPRITQALLDKGYSKADIAKIWSGNVLRVMAEVERVAAE